MKGGKIHQKQIAYQLFKLDIERYSDEAKTNSGI
jgi:hypothetical protein